MQKTILVTLVLTLTWAVPERAQSTASNMTKGIAIDVTNADIQATLRKTASAPVSDQQIRVVSINNGEYNVGIGVLHRSRSSAGGGAIEHSEITEIYQITEGTGTLVTGGTIENPKHSPADGEVVKVLAGPSTTGGPVKNGVSRKVGPGDIIIIPPSTAHWFSEITSDQVVYTVIRVDSRKVLPAGFGAK